MRKDNKGFTLIEIIIAISIFIIVIGIGYSIINNSNKSIGESKVTTQGQSSANLINKYLTKDLERTNPDDLISPTLPQVDTGSYSYMLKVNGFVEDNQNLNFIEYNVDTNNNKYNIERKTYANQDDLNNGVFKNNIQLVSNQSIDRSNNQPFEIIKSESNNIYTVLMQYSDKKNKMYSFDVSCRYNEFVTTGGVVGDGTPDKPLPPDPEPEVDPDMKDMNGFIRFGYKHKDTNPITKNAYVSVGSSKVTNNENREYKRINITDNKNSYSIYSELSFNNSNKKCEARIENGKNNTIDLQAADFGMLAINSINVTLLGDIECKLTISQKISGHDQELYKNINLDKVGKYTFSVEDTNLSGKDIVISGNITKPSDGTFGEVIITFGTKK